VHKVLLDQQVLRVQVVVAVHKVQLVLKVRQVQQARQVSHQVLYYYGQVALEIFQVGGIYVMDQMELLI